MPIKVIGAGLGRSGTFSLKLALEQILGAPCYHMKEVFDHPEHVPLWHAAAEGREVDWDNLFEGYEATVDWPSSSFYKELADHYPDAPVILSTDPLKAGGTAPARPSSTRSASTTPSTPSGTR